jgi:glycosyltransferase involved in cell wall biosynthesis
MNLPEHPRKTNLLIVAAGLGIGGAEVVIQRLAESIDRDRFKVTIACLKMLGPIGEQLAKKGVDVVVLSKKDGRADYFTLFRLLRLIRKRNIDVVHTHTTDALIEAAFCRLFLRRFKLIHTFHFGNYPRPPGKLARFELIGSRVADYLLAVGDVQRNQLKVAYGLKDPLIGRIWNGVNFRARDDGRAFRAQLGVREDQVLIGTLATLIEQKGLFDLLTVARELRDAGSNARFVIVGEGKLRPALEARRRELGLDKVVTLAGWVHSAAEVALPAFDVFFQPSLWEAMSIALLEAMSAGKPAVTTRVGEAPFMVEHESDGLLVDPKDTAGMARALRRLVDDVTLRRNIGAAAAAKVARQFTVEHMTRAYEQVYLAGH